MTYTKPRYEIGADGGLYRWTAQAVAGAKEVLTNYAKAQPCIVRDLLPGCDLKVYPTSRAPVIRCRIDTFILRTWFAPWTDENGVTQLTPVWKDTGCAVETSAAFIPDAGQQLWFFHDTDGSRINYIMWWDSVAQKGYLPPFNNVFGDGHICMGPAWDNDRVDKGGPTMFDKALRARDYYAHETSSNADLSGRTDATRAMLSFHPESRAHNTVSCFGECEAEASAKAATYLAPLTGHIFDGFFEP
jgi:hypothetical protein